jgi:hypothetical protein
VEQFMDALAFLLLRWAWSTSASALYASRRIERDGVKPTGTVFIMCPELKFALFTTSFSTIAV